MPDELGEYTPDNIQKYLDQFKYKTYDECARSGEHETIEDDGYTNQDEHNCQFCGYTKDLV